MYYMLYCSSSGPEPKSNYYFIVYSLHVHYAHEQKYTFSDMIAHDTLANTGTRTHPTGTNYQVFYSKELYCHILLYINQLAMRS